MNIFYYTTSGSNAAKNYSEQLRELPVLKEMTILPAGSLFHSPLALKLRSGDLLLLFAASSEELDELIVLRNEFIDFRIILILADSETQRKAYALHPCFIAFQEKKMMEIEAVIQKIIGAGKGSRRRGFVACLIDRLTKFEWDYLYVNLIYFSRRALYSNTICIWSN